MIFDRVRNSVALLRDLLLVVALIIMLAVGWSTASALREAVKPTPSPSVKAQPCEYQPPGSPGCGG